MKLFTIGLLFASASALAVDSCHALFCTGRANSGKYAAAYRLNCYNGKSHRKVSCLELSNPEPNCMKVEAEDPESLEVRFMHMMAMKGYAIASGYESEDRCTRFYFQKR